jgi:shikimate dehydrogenase
VIGAGGAARAVILALADAGAADVTVVNRTAARAEKAAALAGTTGRVGSGGDVSRAELVVHATPMGMAGGNADSDALPVELSSLHSGQVVVDLVYNPLETAFLGSARAAGAEVVTGLGMLVHQAALALERWTGLGVPVEAMWAAVEPRPGP